jgi:hypothetical protein
MALDKAGNIVYRQVVFPELLRFQADPPVCNICEQEITRRNFGQVYIERRERVREEFEIVECTDCTPIREGGPALRDFVDRHNL